jgi:excisionase family DNA binding protein
MRIKSVVDTPEPEVGNPATRKYRNQYATPLANQPLRVGVVSVDRVKRHAHRSPNSRHLGRLTTRQIPNSLTNTFEPGNRKPPAMVSPPGYDFEPLLDSEEAAALLKIHPKTLQKLAREGKIEAIKIGKLWRFRVSALNRWLESMAS